MKSTSASSGTGTAYRPLWYERQVAYFADLTGYTYSKTDVIELDGGWLTFRPRHDRLNVGWLDAPHTFEQGPAARLEPGERAARTAPVCQVHEGPRRDAAAAAGVIDRLGSPLAQPRPRTRSVLMPCRARAGHRAAPR
ncbi:hypothetical protein Pme01_27200 [Planosporangium mesophilum]|uniref:DUF7919 domain-containing protein n=1 Tax=Planosporangium mesophilum TaxID=689768 RepID=A0A8J3TAR0_9ACTN|nr:hypothetical protein Pme01_27200 [Planosporangium mesophilum]